MTPTVTHVLDILTTAGSSATALGVFMAWWQIRATKQQAVTEFEDELVRDCRKITHEIPVEALLGGQLTDGQRAESMPAFYRYFDLTNAQVFLYRQGRIRDETRRHWLRGMAANLARVEFRRAWELIKERSPDGFGGLRSIEDQLAAVDARGVD